jgi:filamentous hemagglutinin
MEAQGASREAIARRVSNLRNVLKQRSRNMMADRAVAESLPPIRPFEHYVEKYSAEGLSGDALYNRIIERALTPNPLVNAKYGIP